MPDFSIFGAFALVCVLLWIRGEEYRRDRDIYRDKVVKAQTQADEAVKFAQRVLDHAENVFAKLTP